MSLRGHGWLLLSFCFFVAAILVSYTLGDAVGFRHGERLVKTIEVPGPTEYVEVPGPVQYVTIVRKVLGPVRHETVFRTKTIKWCPADELNEAEFSRLK